MREGAVPQPEEALAEEALAEEVARLGARVAELEQQNLRLLADFENQRRRRERDAEELRLNVLREAVLGMLPLADDLARALAAAPQDDPLRAGVSLVEKNLAEVLRRFGAQPIAALGEPFDPALHEAVAEDPSEETPGTVIAELRRGWRLDERVIRPALVRVARARE